MNTNENGVDGSRSNGLPPIKTTIGTRGWRARRHTTRFMGSSLGSALVLSVACGAGLLLASQLRSGSPWTGLNVLASAAGKGARRPKRFDATRTLTGVGLLAAGLFVVSSLYQGGRLATGRR